MIEINIKIFIQQTIIDGCDYELPDLLRFFYTDLKSTIKARKRDNETSRRFQYQEMKEKISRALYDGVDPEKEIYFQCISKENHTPLAKRSFKEKLVNLVKSFTS